MNDHTRRDPGAEGHRVVLDLRRQLNHAINLANHALHFTSVGQKVSVKDNEVHKPEQLGVVFTIAQVVGQGADAFVSLQAPDGTIAEWFRADELQPAIPSVEKPAYAPVRAVGSSRQSTTGRTSGGASPTDKSSDATTRLMALASTIAAKQRIPFGRAMVEASRQQPADARDYHVAFNVGPRDER